MGIFTPKSGYQKQETYAEKRAKKIRPFYGWILGITLVWLYISITAGGYAADNSVIPITALPHILEIVTKDPLYGVRGGVAIIQSMQLFIVGAFVIGLFALWSYLTDTSRINHDQNTVKGSSEWGDPIELSKKYAEYTEKGKGKKSTIDFESAFSNTYLARNTVMSLDTNVNPLAMNSLIVGTTGSGKSRFFLKPNALQMNASYIFTDPSGGVLIQIGETLRRFGYNIRIFDINNMGMCSTYNPIKYCYEEADIKKLVDAFIKNTGAASENQSSNADPFWDNAMNAYLCSVIALLVNYGDDPEIMCGKTYIPCFASVAELTRMANKKAEQPGGMAARRNPDAPTSAASELNIIFENVRKKYCPTGAEEKPYALREWENFKIAPEKTSTTILMTAAVKLDPFNIDKVRDLTTSDTICLDTFDDQKDALFIIIPAGDEGPYNFLASFLYTQLFDVLYRKAERNAGTSAILTKEGEIIRSFNKEEVVNGDDEKFRQSLSEATIKEIVVNGEITGKNKAGATVTVNDAYYDIILPDGSIVGRRPTRAKAEEFKKSLATAKIKRGDGVALFFPVRMLLDEFANIGEIPSFKERLATVRKYHISVTVIVQNIPQLKGMYPDDYETIDSNCPETIFLGGDDNTTTEYISKKIGDSTVIVRSSSMDAKNSTSSSFNTDTRALIKPEELGRMPYSDCVVMIYGNQAIMDKKCDYPKHKNYKYTNDFGADFGIGDKYMVFDRSVYDGEITKINPIDSNPKLPAKVCNSILPTIHGMALTGDVFAKIFNRDDNDIMDIANNISNLAQAQMNTLPDISTPIV